MGMERVSVHTTDRRKIHCDSRSTMMHEDGEVIDSTRRCLFPAEAGDTSFETELDSSAMIEATHPSYLDNNDSDDDDEEGKNPLPMQRHSPTGVGEFFPSAAHLAAKEPLQSTIIMGENGAEVTLTMAQTALVTPEQPTRLLSTPVRKGFVHGNLRDNSLMDIDWTPTPPPLSKQKPVRHGQKNNLNYAWCGNSSTNCVLEDTYEMPSDEHPNLEEIISSFLVGGDEDSTPMKLSNCYDWQEWSFPLADRSMDDGSIGSIRLKLRKRVLNLKARQKRVHQLRRDLSPFSKSPARGSPQLFRSRSFSVSDHASAIVRQSKELERSQSSCTNVLQLCTLPENAVSESPMLMRYNTRTDGEDVCYDSDPEDFARRRSASQPSPSNNKENRSRYTDYPSTIKTRDALDEFAYSNAVQEFLNRTSTLVYHPTLFKEGGRAEPSTPIAIDAWLERGQRLRELIQPKWMWRPKPRYKEKRSLVRSNTVSSMELLNITRILKVARVDRQIYPFAKPCNSLLVRTIEGREFCFEAKSEEERDLIVFSLKLVIARFGAMVLATNHRVYEEFFVHDACVPGEPPHVLDLLSQSCDSEDSD